MLTRIKSIKNITRHTDSISKEQGNKVGMIKTVQYTTPPSQITGTCWSLDLSQSLWMWPEAVIVNCAWSILHSSRVPLQRRVPVRCLYHYSQEHVHIVVYSPA